MGKWACNAADVSLISGVTRQRIMPRVSDTSAELENSLSICLLR